MTFGRIEAMARHLTEQHWAAIQRVAVALNTWRELAPCELEGLRRGQ
jgi:hypothetical protein